jgi:2-phospho-L-lactate guanylyltransferase
LIWGVIPVKSFRAAKSRLSGLLSPRQRAELARTMFEHVHNTLRLSEHLDGILVVTDSEDIARRASNMGVRALRDPPDDGSGRHPLTQVVEAALTHLAGLRVDVGLVVMGDLPELRITDIELIKRAKVDNDVIISPDRRSTGTNALCASVDAGLALHFGQPDSFARHRRAAQERGLSVQIYRSPTVALDIDVAADYRTWLERPDRF